MPKPPFHFSQLLTPAFLGIVNITPDSFSDTGQHFDPAAAIAHGRALFADGAQILDLGAEASSFFRKGTQPISPDEQLRRLLPVVRELAKSPGIYLSVDTRSAAVAREVLAHGVHIINDISAGTHDPDMLPAVAHANAAIILMHITPGYPKTPLADDPDILQTVAEYLGDRIAAARSAGMATTQIAIDPGIGFGKTMRDNWTLALTAQKLSNLAVPVVLGISRKRFLETPPPPDLLPAEKWHALLESARGSRFSVSPHPRDPATAALTQITLENGMPLHRVHIVPLAKNSILR